MNLYRRHRPDCEGGHPFDSRSGEFQERKKTWRKCACYIFASGTLQGHYKRKYTGTSDWAEAKAVADQWDAAGSWVAKPQPAAAPPPVPASEQRITIERALKSYTAELEEHAAPNTRKKNRIQLAKLKAFGDSRGYVVLDQWTPTDLREFRSSWSVSPQTAMKNMSTIKAFFEFCFCSEWITRNPARLVKNLRGRDAAERRNEQKQPFTDEELRAMYEACETRYGKQEITWSRTIHHHKNEGEYVRYNYKWTGQDLADFISVSVYTGLRISDVSTFRIDRMLDSGEILIRTTKAGTHVYTWVPKWLQERIKARAEQFGPLIFGEHRTKDINVITDVWRRKLNNLWELCGPWKEKPTPHRFRHTFARILLQRPGVTVRDVAELLGNSEQMVRKHYAAWIPERQARLTRILQDAFEDRPKPNLIAMPTPR